MKLPNGTGGVSKLPGKRRKPWRARITKGWAKDPATNNYKQQYYTLGYYATRKEALVALMDFNQNPYDIDASDITFEEVYQKWSAVHFPTISDSCVNVWRAAFNHSAPLYNMRMRDIKVSHLEGCINDADVGSATKTNMKNLYNMMYKYAMKLEIVDKNYATLCDSVRKDKPTITRTPFSVEEIQTLADNLDTPFVDAVLFGIYTGWRAQEIVNLKLNDVDIEAATMRGGVKTAAGKNRIVPIHSAIIPLVEARMNVAKESSYSCLFVNRSGCPLTYRTYRARWDNVMAELNMNHLPHDTRHTFVSLGKEYDMDEYVLKLIVGHSVQDITEDVYTHRSIDRLRTEIEKIPNLIMR